jgi:hypothetical protein
MGLRASFDCLSAVIEQYDRDGRSVRHVDARGGDDGRLHATLEVPVSLCAAESGALRPAVSPTRATLTDDGSLQVEFTTPEAAALPEPATVENQTVRVTDGGDILLRVSVVVDAAADDATVDDPATDRSAARDSAGDDPVTDETSSGESRAATPASDAAGDSRGAVDGEDESDPAAVRDESIPAYEDTAYLQRLYETCDTFAEMSREIEMDVAGETVRRYMIDAGVHEPSRYETADDGSGEVDRASATERARSASDAAGDGPESESKSSEAGSVEASVDSRATELPDEQFVTDGIGLPDGVRIEDIAEAVTASSTVYDVQRRLDLEGEQTWELLQQLDLLELLVGRIRDGRERSISYESVTGRIRQSTANTA